MDKLRIYNLAVEVTRRCNAECEHCLRGDRESLDLNMVYIESLFKRVEYINCITFTGGEPTLATNQIHNILRLAEKYEVDVGSFYIVTNAIRVPDSFLLACIKWYCYCSDNEITQVVWSNDDFHELPDEGVKRLQALGFTSPKYSSAAPSPYANVINEGRGVNFGHDRHSRTSVEIEDDNEINGDLYLNVKGKLVDGCDWSYASQEDHTICCAGKLSLPVLQKYLDERES